MTSVSQKTRTNVYLDSEMKAKAQEIFKTYGMGLSDAFNMFLSQSVLERGIPFDIKIPNAKTKQVLKDAEEGRNMEEITLKELKAEMDAIRNA